MDPQKQNGKDHAGGGRSTCSVSTRVAPAHKHLVQRLGPVLRRDEAFAESLGRALNSGEAMQELLPAHIGKLEDRIARLEHALAKLNESTVNFDPPSPGDDTTVVSFPADISPFTPQRRLAEHLVAKLVPDKIKGGLRVMTRSEIEAEIQQRLKVSRDVAQAAASRAVNKLDPNNAARRSHRKPVARKIGPELESRIRQLAAEGHPPMSVAKSVGAHVRTVKKVLAKSSS